MALPNTLKGFHGTLVPNHCLRLCNGTLSGSLAVGANCSIDPNYSISSFGVRNNFPHTRTTKHTLCWSFIHLFLPLLISDIHNSIGKIGIVELRHSQARKSFLISLLSTVLARDHRAKHVGSG